MNSPTFDLQKLLCNVFAPQADETVVVMTDSPHGELVDHADWQERRRMAEEWLDGFRNLGLEVKGLVTYPATGAHNADLPELGRIDGQEVTLSDVLSDCNIAVAMTEYSATAPLSMLAHGSNGRLRVASMPGVLRRMEQTALSADYQQVAERVHRLQELLTRAESADVVFTTGHRVLFDLRYRHGHGDDGLCTPSTPEPVINLPSGEAYIVPYEGERDTDPSLTQGAIPVQLNDEIAILEIVANRITRIQGESAEARELREFFDIDPARANVAELGLGCNERAVITGNVLEDEKAGLHWAYGRSEHLGGTIGPDAFKSSKNVVHRDIVYAHGCPIGIASVMLHFLDGSSCEIMRDSEYSDLSDLSDTSD